MFACLLVANAVGARADARVWNAMRKARNAKAAAEAAEKAVNAARKARQAKIAAPGGKAPKQLPSGSNPSPQSGNTAPPKSN